MTASSYTLKKEGASMIRLAGDVDDQDILRLRAEGEAMLATFSGQCVIDLQAFRSSRSVVLSTLLCWQRAGERRKLIVQFSGIEQKMYDMARVSGLDAVLHFSAPDAH